MTDKLMYIPNVNIQILTFCILKLVDETLGHSTLLTNQSKFIKSLQSCLANYKKTLL